jgi:uncharacterized repeat protein (TIGR03803 family)
VEQLRSKETSFGSNSRTGRSNKGIFETLAALVFAAGSVASAQTLTTIYSFCPNGGACVDGGNVRTGLVQGSDGNFYGTTNSGGDLTPSGGTVYKVTPTGTFTTLYNFCSLTNCADGSLPYAGLARGSDGNFYGTTSGGGAFSAGTVFKITPSGVFSTLHSFASITNSQGVSLDGVNPMAGLVEGTDGNFYGTTFNGGANGSLYAGTVFKITPFGALTTLYTFCAQTNCVDGQNPEATLVQGTDGNFYGTTFSGGANGAFGTVFKITPQGALTTLHSFCSQASCADGGNPTAGLVQDSTGTLYGTTGVYGANGSDSNGGTVFKVTTSGALTTLYTFCSLSPSCADGSVPSGGVIIGIDGRLYGTTSRGGGVNPYGTVFKLTPSGALTTLYSFCSQTNCQDGGIPFAGLIQASNENFYGTTAIGGPLGTLGFGTIFELSLSPIAKISTTSLAFPNQTVNTSSASLSVTLSNAGAGSLGISSIAISGANASDFSQTNNCGTSVAANASCTITVTFKPTAAGARAGTLTITDNSNGVAGSGQTVSLSGTGISAGTPGSTLSPTSEAFGNQVVNTTSASKTMTLKNSGTAALSISSITITGTNAADFHETNTCPATLNPAATCTIGLTYTPTITGSETAHLTVTDNAANSPQTLALTGAGILPVVVSPTSLTFTSQIVGTKSAARTITLTNNMTTAITVGSLTLTGSDPTEFTQTNTCGKSLARNGKCTISVTFKPAAKGTRTATLNINDSAGNSPQTVSLTGTGK